MSDENFRLIPPPPQRPNEVHLYVTKEQKFTPVDDISVREYSKEEMIDERSVLASEILSERTEGREKSRELNQKIEELNALLEREQQNIESFEISIGEVETLRAERASTIAGKVKHFLNIETAEDEHVDMLIEAMRENVDFSKTKHAEIAVTLEESMNELVDVDTRLKSLKDKIAGFYEGVREGVMQTVEQSIVRNNAFFVHTINENPKLRHNAFSNVSQETTFEDDLDIFLSLEPSVSASSVIPGLSEEGKVSGLWGDSGGLLIGRGKISGAFAGDMDTRSVGVKNRTIVRHDGKVSTHSQIDTAVQKSREIDPYSVNQPYSYNEFVIDNPEAIGYFSKCFVDEQGFFWTNETVRKQYIESRTHVSEAVQEDSAKMLKRNISFDLQKLNTVRERGLPYFVMTPERKFFEVIRIHDNGQILVGDELTPEQAVHRNAGLPPEQRKQLGKRVLEKQVFNHERTMLEARHIIEKL